MQRQSDLRIVHVTRDYPLPRRGGISTAVHGLVQHAPEGGLAQAVLSLERERRDSQASPGPVPILRAGSGANPADLVAWAEQHCPDVVHLHDSFLWPVAEAICTRRRAPLVCSVHVDQRTMATRRGLATAHRSLLAQDAALRYASRIIVPSRTAGATLAAADVAIAHKICVVPHGIAIAATPLATGGQRQQPITGPILNVGRYDELKGTADLFAALPELLAARPQQRAVIVGGLPAAPRSQRRWHRRWQEAWPAAIRARIELRGWLDAEAVEELYLQAGVVVVPSHYETFGLVAAEAMARGTAVVAARGGALADLIEDGVNGLSFAVADRAGLVRQTSRVLDDPELAFRLGQSAAAQVRATYTWQRAWSALLPLYTDAAGRSAEKSI